MFILFKKIYISLNFLFLYLYLYLTPFFNKFYKNTDIMRKFRYGNYLDKMNSISKKIDLFDNIKIEGLDNLIIDKYNFLLFNHSSVIDNFIISKLFDNSNIGYDDLRTVSKMSRNLQNIALEIHESLLVSYNLSKDIKTTDIVTKKWIRSKNNIQIILFPE